MAGQFNKIDYSYYLDVFYYALTENGLSLKIDKDALASQLLKTVKRKAEPWKERPDKGNQDSNAMNQKKELKNGLID